MKTKFKVEAVLEVEHPEGSTCVIPPNLLKEQTTLLFKLGLDSHEGIDIRGDWGQSHMNDVPEHLIDPPFGCVERIDADLTVTSVERA